MKKFLIIFILFLFFPSVVLATWESQGYEEDTTLDGTEKVFLENGAGTENNYFGLSNLPTYLEGFFYTETEIDDALDLKQNISSLETDVEAIVDLQDLQGAVTDVQVPDDITITALSGKQDTLVSGTNIKTLNSETVLGSGDIEILETVADNTAYDSISWDDNTDAANKNVLRDKFESLDSEKEDVANKIIVSDDFVTLSQMTKAEMQAWLGSTVTSYTFTWDLVNGNGADKITYDSTDYTVDGFDTGLTADASFTVTPDTDRQASVTGSCVTGTGPYSANTDSEDCTATVTFSPISAGGTLAFLAGSEDDSDPLSTGTGNVTVYGVTHTTDHNDVTDGAFTNFSVTNYVSIPSDNIDVNIGSFSMWINVATTTGAYANYFAYDTDTTPDDLFKCYVYGNATTSRCRFNNVAYDFTHPNLWGGVDHHIAFTWNHTTNLVEMFVDNVSVGSHTITAVAPTIGAGTVYIGNSSDQSSPMTGTVLDTIYFTDDTTYQGWGE